MKSHTILYSFSKTIEMDTPITPEEFLGQEPSLVDLIYHHRENITCYEDIDTSMLKNYLSIYNHNQVGFYLGGQLKIELTEEIKKSNIDKAKELIEKKNKEYGEPTNAYEAASIKKAAEDFENIQKIIERYYKIQMHELYRPPNPDISNDLGGLGYQKIEKATRIGKTA